MCSPDLLADGAGRRRAAVALGDEGSPEARATLREILADDPFWAVREAAAGGLDPEAAEDRQSLTEAATADPKSNVRAAALARLGARAEPGFLIARFRADSSYLAQAAALTALGATGSAAARPVLEEAAAMTSPRDIVARAAREALAR